MITTSVSLIARSGPTAPSWRSRLLVTRLVTYPGESHLFILDGAPSHRADWNRRIAEWVQEHATGAGKPRRVTLDAAHWQQRLAELATIHSVLGASLGIQRLGDERVLAHHGVLSTATGVEVTDHSVFQIGSITKAWTTTVVMQLVCEGSSTWMHRSSRFSPSCASPMPRSAGRSRCGTY